MSRVLYACTSTTYIVFTYSSFLIYYSVGERTWVFAFVSKILPPSGGAALQNFEKNTDLSLFMGNSKVYFY